MVKEKMYDEALKEFEVALEIEPRSKEILMQVFDLAVITKNKEKAGNTLNLIKRFHPGEDLSELEKKLSELK